MVRESGSGHFEESSALNVMIGFFLRNKPIVALIVVLVVAWGLMVAPFDWDLGGLPRDPVPVDAIPDIGENQQIVFTEWMGRSPQDVDQPPGQQPPGVGPEPPPEGSSTKAVRWIRLSSSNGPHRLSQTSESLISSIRILAVTRSTCDGKDLK